MGVRDNENIRVRTKEKRLVLESEELLEGEEFHTLKSVIELRGEFVSSSRIASAFIN